MNKKLQTINCLLPESRFNKVKHEGIGWASSNIALCKYWGKRDLSLNLPNNSSLSVSLGNKGTLTKIRSNDRGVDAYKVNGSLIDESSDFARRLREFLDLFRNVGSGFELETENNLPTAAGFASSASGFAALVKGLNDLYDWDLKSSELSILARLGSGSACRSIEAGFVKWDRGVSADGLDSYGQPLAASWPNLRVGLLILSTEIKKTSSREAMFRTVHTSPNYGDWLIQAEKDLIKLLEAIASRDLERLGEISECNSNLMHQVMVDAVPPIIYTSQETKAASETIKRLRAQGTLVFYTQDAGENLVLLFEVKDELAIIAAFPSLEIVAPFTDSSANQLILVDKDDNQVGTEAKMTAHLRGLTHRAFSVVVLRKTAGQLEILLQQRSASKYHTPNLWSNACCGHPRPQEGIVAAGEQRLFEELGIRLSLVKKGVFHYRSGFGSGSLLIEDEVDHVLVGFSEAEQIPYNITEVQACEWLGISELKRRVNNFPEQYTPWFLILLEKFNYFQGY